MVVLGRSAVSYERGTPVHHRRRHGSASARLQGPRERPPYFTEMCSGSEAGSYLRLTDFVCHPTLGLSVIKRKPQPTQAATWLGWCTSRGTPRAAGPNGAAAPPSVAACSSRCVCERERVCVCVCVRERECVCVYAPPSVAACSSRHVPSS